MNKKNKGDKYKIEDKYFKASIPGLNRLLNVLGIPGEIDSILPTEYQNYRKETKIMDLVFDMKSKETLNLEFKSNYITKEDVENSLDYAAYLRIKYKKKTNSYFISTKNKNNAEYQDEWHNSNKYAIPLKTFKELDADEHLNNLRKMIKEGRINEESEELNDLLLIPFMKSENEPKELIVQCIIFANQINAADKDKINDIKNMLLFLARKYTDTKDEFKNIEKLVKMEGGMIENTINQIKEIYKEEGIEEGTQIGTKQGIQIGTEQGIQIGIQQEKEEIAKKLKENGMKTKEIRKITELTEKQIEKL